MIPFGASPNPVDLFGTPRRPDFFCIGSEKAGTTWLWHSMLQHPEIGVPQTKELRYFNGLPSLDLAHFRALKTFLEDTRNAPKRPQFLERVATEMRLLYGGEDAYLRIFGQLTGRVVGELTPQYCLLSRDRIKAMKALSPDARIIYMLRDPTDRIIAGAKMVCLREGDTMSDAAILLHAKNPIQERLSNTAWHLEKFESVFGKERIHLALFDDIKTRPNALLAEICAFLGVPPHDIPRETLSKPVNKGSDFRPSPEVQKTLYRRLRRVYLELEPRFPQQVATWSARYQ